MALLPDIDISAYLADPSSAQAQDVIKAVHQAASSWGVFTLRGTHITRAQRTAVIESAKQFFDLPMAEKMTLDVASGGVAWRGYMPLGGEHTHGRQDWKEGLYIGVEHPDDHPLNGMPLHGRNQFPDTALPHMRGTVLEYVDQVCQLGKCLTDIISLGLGLSKNELGNRWLKPDPILLFRCFKYAPLSDGEASSAETQDSKKGYGIGEHTDFGYLTILMVDSPGLQFLSPSDTWVDVPVLDDAFIVNVGDMLDRLTHGRFRSRPHRVLRPSAQCAPRYSFPMFFDFAWDAKMEQLPLDHHYHHHLLAPLTDADKQAAQRRWANTTFRQVDGTWAQYLARKMQKVFPHLRLPDFDSNAAPSSRFTRVVGADKSCAS